MHAPSGLTANRLLALDGCAQSCAERHFHRDFDLPDVPRGVGGVLAKLHEATVLQQDSDVDPGKWRDG
jgi:hypothetical protein